MSEDYLTSPFYDDNFKNAIKVMNSFTKNAENVRMMQESIRMNLRALDYLPNLTMQLSNSFKYNKLVLNSSLDALEDTKKIIQSLSKLYTNDTLITNKEFINQYLKTSSSNLFYLKNLDIYNFNFDKYFNSLIKEESKQPNQEPKQSCSQINSKSEGNIKTESDEVENLNIAFINFEFHAERFKEVFHKSYSYASERKVVVFGVANAFAYLVTSAAQVHPLLPFWIFSIVSVIGLFTPRD